MRRTWLAYGAVVALLSVIGSATGAQVLASSGFGYSGYSGYSGSGYSGGFSGYSGVGYSGGYSGSGSATGGAGSSWAPSGGSPYGTEPYYAGTDTATVEVGGQTFTVPAAEFASAQNPSGSGVGYGGTVSAIQVASLTTSELAALTETGFQVSDGYVEVTSSLAPAGTSVTYNGGETNLYGGNGSITITGPAGGTSGGGTSGQSGSGGGSGGTSGGSSGSGLAWSVTLAPSATQVPVGQSVTLTATTNQQLGPTPYWLLIENGSGSVLASCGSGTTCSATETEVTASTQTYTALVADYGGSNVQATSAPVSVTWYQPVPAPTVSAPQFNPDPAYPGQQVCASTTVTNASSVSLSLPGGGSLGLTGPGKTWTGCFEAPGPGTYTLRTSATGAGGPAQASGTLTVSVPQPVAAFSVSPNPVVAGWQTVTYADQSSAGGYGASIASEAWSLSGPGGSWSGASASALPTMFQTPGSYTVTLQVANNYGASASVSHTLSVLPAPTLSITVTPSMVEPGQTVTVSAQWSGWTSASINVSQFGAGTWPQAGSGTWSRPFTLGQGNYSACIVGSLAGQTRQACASTTVLTPTAPVLTQ